MKKRILSFIFISCLFTACGDDKKTNDTGGTEKDTITTTMDVENEVENLEAANDSIVTVTGKVLEINQGKDGYTAKLYSTAGPEYFATISIPNMDDPKQYRAVKEGDLITVSGEPFMVGEENYIKVTVLEE